MAGQIDLKPYLDMLGQEINLVVGTVKNKGSKRFGRAFGAAGFLLFAAYMGLYRPPQQKSSRLAAQIAKAKMLHDYGSQYSDLRDQLRGAYRRLPLLKDRDQWLSNSVRDSLSAGGLLSEDFKPVQEQEVQGLLFQTSSVSLNVRFAEFYDWLLRLESAKPMMHLSLLDLTKMTDKPGYNRATCEVSTVIPKRRFP
jgi:hypothetical protein